MHRILLSIRVIEAFFRILFLFYFYFLLSNRIVLAIDLIQVSYVVFFCLLLLKKSTKCSHRLCLNNTIKKKNRDISHANNSSVSHSKLINAKFSFLFSQLNTPTPTDKLKSNTTLIRQQQQHIYRISWPFLYIEVRQFSRMTEKKNPNTKERQKKKKLEKFYELHHRDRTFFHCYNLFS